MNYLLTSLLTYFITDLIHYLLTSLLTYFITYLLHYLLNDSTEQSPTSEANRFSTSQEIPHILWNPKVH